MGIWGQRKSSGHKKRLTLELPVHQTTYDWPQRHPTLGRRSFPSLPLELPFLAHPRWKTLARAPVQPFLPSRDLTAFLIWSIC